jgi:hypothetical protein
VDAFDNAVGLLRGRGLVSDARDGQLVALANGSRADEIVRVLVENKFAVHEITPHEQTLEAFYLSLVNAAPSPESTRRTESLSRPAPEMGGA